MTEATRIELAAIARGVELSYQLRSQARTLGRAATLVWLLPVDILPEDLLPDVDMFPDPGNGGREQIHGIPVRRVAGLERPYLAHQIADTNSARAPLGDPTNPQTAIDAVAAGMEAWIEKYHVDFFPEGRRGAPQIVQSLLDLGWRPPADEPTHDDTTVRIDSDGDGGSVLVARRADGRERTLSLAGGAVTLAQLKAAFR